MSYTRHEPLTYLRLVGPSLLTAIIGSLVGSILFSVIVEIDVAVRNGTALNLGDSLPFFLGFAVVAAPLGWAGLLLVGIPMVVRSQESMLKSPIAAYSAGLSAGVLCGGIAAGLWFFSPAIPIGMLFGAVFGLLWVAMARRIAGAAALEGEVA